MPQVGFLIRDWGFVIAPPLNNIDLVGNCPLRPRHTTICPTTKPSRTGARGLVQSCEPARRPTYPAWMPGRYPRRIKRKTMMKGSKLDVVEVREVARPISQLIASRM